jgi:AraC-like DNA-binding protein
MQLASDLLATKEKAIKTIAQVVGFETYYGFAHVFKRCFSTTATRA